MAVPGVVQTSNIAKLLQPAAPAQRIQPAASAPRLQPTLSAQRLQPATSARQLQPTVAPSNSSGGLVLGAETTAQSPGSWRDDPRANDPNWSFSMNGGWQNVGDQRAAAAAQAEAQARAQAVEAARQAAEAEAKRVSTLRAGFATQRGNIFSSSNEAAGALAKSYHLGILDFLDSLHSGQQRINNEAVNNELAHKQGTQGVMDMVGRGLRSGGVMLANKNASSSSAADQLARAYGEIGRGQLTGVNNQYELGNKNIAQEQSDFGVQQASGVRNLQGSKDANISSIVSSAQNSLAALDAAMVNASIPDRVDIEAEKANVRNQALSQLAQYDQELTSGVSGVQPTSVDARRAEATRLASLGQAPANAFSFTSSTPAQFQGTGPFASELPIFTLPFGKKQLA